MSCVHVCVCHDNIVSVMIACKQIELQKFYFNEHLTHSCVGMPQGLQALIV